LLDTGPVRSEMVYSGIGVRDQLQLAIEIVVLQEFDFAAFQIDTWFEMQMAVKKARQAKHNSEATNLMELKHGESGILDRLDLPEDDARRLMELGFLPGHAITPGHSAPGGDPRVFRVDGSEVALRRDTARRLILRHENCSHNAAKES
jgi:ferrous iron transport protein A